jgi:hypothetical protein
MTRANWSMKGEPMTKLPEKVQADIKAAVLSLSILTGSGLPKDAVETVMRLAKLAYLQGRIDVHKENVNRIKRMLK